MGTDLYHYIILNSHLVIGNSSSGIFEAPSLKTPTLNVGDRQEGRIMGSSVFNCKNEPKDLKKNISHILKKKNIDFKNVFYKKDTSLKILKQIKRILREKSYNKKFYDIK